LEPVYGIDTLIKAFKIVKDKLSSSQLKLLIVGEGNQRKELDCLVANLSLEDSVIFTGYVPSSQIVEYFHKIDIFVNLSIRESFGVSVLEALACKIPVIVSDVGGLKEIVINNECGFLVEPNNVMETAVAMEKLIMDKEKRNKFGDAGRIRVKKYFEWNKNLSDVVKVYEHYLK
jgi:glycosyltransferase involved in cell wall biosynthesis